MATKLGVNGFWIGSSLAIMSIAQALQKEITIKEEAQKSKELLASAGVRA